MRLRRVPTNIQLSVSEDWSLEDVRLQVEVRYVRVIRDDQPGELIERF